MVLIIFMPTNEIVQVGRGKWKSGFNGRQLQASGISAEVVVALSSERTGRGYLGVFDPDGMTELQAMLRTARREARGATRLWYGGCALVSVKIPDAVEVNDRIRRLREHVQRVASGQDFQQIYTQWLPIGKLLEMTLTCGTRNCSIRSR